MNRKLNIAPGIILNDDGTILAKRAYTGSVYVGCVGSENDIGECRDSIEHIVRQPGDSRIEYIRATKGYEARQMHINKWITKTQHDFCLLLDHDMTFPPDTLEKLRAHGLPFISGFYMRRRYSPIAPVWFEYNPTPKFPMRPFIIKPQHDRLYPLAASGWGCMLLHRDVIRDTLPILKGEQVVIEDDMDIWPYDLRAVLFAIRGLRALVTEQPDTLTLYPALDAHTQTLEREIRMLRGCKDMVGSDLRFPFYARQAGYILMGDPTVACGHSLNYPLSPADFEGMPAESQEHLARAAKGGYDDEARKLAREQNRLKGKE